MLLGPEEEGIELLWGAEGQCVANSIVLFHDYLSFHSSQISSRVASLATFRKCIPSALNIPTDSWMCPKTWYLGWRCMTMSRRYFEPEC
jgi:hypothetical protein